MKHTIHGLALSNVRQNRSRSILIILSIFLTTLLLSSIAGIGCGLVRHNRINAGNLYGNYCGTFNRITEEQYENVKLRSEFTHVGRTAYTAEVKPEGTGSSIDLSLVFMDNNAAENMNFGTTLKAGALPAKENEITAPEKFFSHLGLNNAKLGDTVAISFRRDNQSQFQEKEFVVSGIIKAKENGIAQKLFQGYISQKFYESLYLKEMRSYGVNFRLNDSVGINGDNYEELLQELGELCGVEKNAISPNTLYLIWAYDPGTEIVLSCIMIAIVVILVSVAVIYNIFQVGMVQKIQEYGKIKALGTTKKQMKKLILREGMLLAAIGIPLGLLAGCGVASVLFRMLMYNANELWIGVELKKSSVISLPLMVIVVLAALVTIRLALAHPMRVAAKISPVEAIRYQENTSRKKGIRKGRRRISVMTLSSLSANRRRTVSTILTMGLSCVLFVVLSQLAGNIDNEFEARRSIEYGQFSIFMEDYGYDLGQQVDMKDLTGGQAAYQGEIMGAFGSAPVSWVITEETFQKLGITEDVTETL